MFMLVALRNLTNEVGKEKMKRKEKKELHVVTPLWFYILDLVKIKYDKGYRGILSTIRKI
jgi:hypothetical protein